MKNSIFFTLILTSFHVFGNSYNIKDYGAKADGKTVNTAFIQKAIDECNAQGGGTVVVPAGTFITGTIFLKSHVNLHVEHAGVLKGSDKLSDFQANGITHGMVYAIDCEDISLTGEGEINGNGTHFMIPDKRHNFIDYDTKYIRQGAAFMQGETGVGGYTETARQQSYKFGNKTKTTENVVVTNCVLQSRSAGIRIGYGMNNVRNLIFSNLTIVDTNRGIGIFCRDDSQIENITFSNIHIQCRLHTGKWWGRGEPIHISSIKQTGIEKLGKIKGIRFSNVKITQAEAGIVVYGNAKSVIEDLDFQDVEINLQNGALSKTYGGNFDMRPSAERSTSLFKHDIPAFYAGFVKNMKVTNYTNTWKDASPADYYTNGFFVENYDGLILEKMQVMAANASHKKMVLKNGKRLINRTNLTGFKSL